VRRRRVDVGLTRCLSGSTQSCGGRLVKHDPVRREVERALTQADAGHPDNPLLVRRHLRCVVVRSREWLCLDVLMELDVAMRDGLRVRLVRVVDMLLGHDGSEDQTRHQGKRGERATQQNPHVANMDAHRARSQRSRIDTM